MTFLFVVFVMLALLCLGCALCGILQSQWPPAEHVVVFLEALLPGVDTRG